MDSWWAFNETKLPTKEEFYSNSNMENITDADYKHAKNVWRDFKSENLGDYHNFVCSKWSIIIGSYIWKLFLKEGYWNKLSWSC